MPRDQNGNEIATADEDRINRNMARFLSTEKQQKQDLSNQDFGQFMREQKGVRKVQYAP